MSGKLKFILYENDKTIDTIEKETSTESSQLLKSLEDFRQIVNESFTKKIEDNGLLETRIKDCSNVLIEVREDYIDSDISTSDGEEESDQQMTSPKKRKI